MISRFLILLVRVYQNSISLILPSSCRFSPTCSEYMIESLKRHGTFRGLVIGLKRIGKCHPFSKYSGWDPL